MKKAHIKVLLFIFSSSLLLIQRHASGMDGEVE
jgi:hypothetical protein